VNLSAFIVLPPLQKRYIIIDAYHSEQHDKGTLKK